MGEAGVTVAQLLMAGMGAQSAVIMALWLSFNARLKASDEACAKDRERLARLESKLGDLGAR